MRKGGDNEEGRRQDEGEVTKPFLICSQNCILNFLEASHRGGE
jgi:hypothetical protein